MKKATLIFFSISFFLINTKVFAQDTTVTRKNFSPKTPVVLIAIDTSKTKADSIRVTVTTDKGVPVKIQTPEISTIDSTNVFLSVFSDFLGFKQNAPNGLIQTEFWGNGYINKNGDVLHLFKSDCFTKREIKLYPLHNAIFMFNLSKIGNSNDTRYKQVDYFKDTLLANNNNPDSIVHHMHTFDLIKYSNLSFVGKLNFAALYFDKPHLKFFLDGYCVFYSTGVHDSLFEGSTRKDWDFNIYSVGYGLNCKAISYINQSFNLEISYTGYNLTLLNSNSIKQNTGNLYYPETNPKNSLFVEDDNKKINTRVGIYSVQVFCVPKSKAKTNIIFFRISYYSNTLRAFKKGNFVPTGYNDYLQVQVGYRKTFDFDKFINQK